MLQSTKAVNLLNLKLNLAAGSRLRKSPSSHLTASAARAPCPLLTITGPAASLSSLSLLQAANKGYKLLLWLKPNHAHPCLRQSFSISYQARLQNSFGKILV